MPRHGAVLALQAGSKRRAGIATVPWSPTASIASASRNPIHVGLSLTNIAIALRLALWRALAILRAVWPILHFGVARREEACLAGRFGKTCRARTRRYR